MNLIFWIVLKATLILLAGLALVSTATKARAAVRHLFLACTFAALLIIPVVSLVATPSVIKLAILEPVGPKGGRADRTVDQQGNLEASERSIIAEAGTVLPTSGEPTKPPAIFRTGLVSLVWAGGVASLAVAFVAALLRLRAIRRRGLPWLAGEDLANRLARTREISKGISLALHEGVSAPITYGLIRPFIVLPPDATSWAEADLQRALVHELEHVRRRDWVVQMMARGVCALYWFHPLVWVAWRRLCLESERACDDAVLLGSQGADYAQQLVGLAQRLSTGEGGLVLSMANRSDLSVRVRAVLDGNQTRGRAGRTAVAAVAGLAALLAVSVAPVSVVAVARETVEQETSADDRTAAEKALVEKMRLERMLRRKVERAEQTKRERLEILQKMRVEAELAKKSPREREELTRKLLHELAEHEKALATAGGVEGGVSGGLSGGVAGGIPGGVEDALQEKEIKEQSAIIEKLSREQKQLFEKQAVETAALWRKVQADYRKGVELDAVTRVAFEKKMVEQEREFAALAHKLERGERRSGRRVLGEALISAAEEGDIAFVTELLDGGLDVNTVVQGDGTALIGAARGSQLAMTEFLIGRGANPNVVAQGDGSPLIMAAREGAIDVVRLLLDRGADINLGVPGDGNPLIMAAGAGELEVVKLLLDRGADIERIVPGDENPLIHASEQGSIEVVTMLVDRGANINARVQAERWDGSEKGSEWRTPLSMARRNGHRKVIEFLVSRGAIDAQP